MDLLDELRMLLDYGYAALGPKADRLRPKSVQAVLTRIDQMRTDALRWDWVRTHLAKRIEVLVPFLELRWGICHAFPPADTLDAAVDAEMAEEAKRQGAEG